MDGVAVRKYIIEAIEELLMTPRPANFLTLEPTSEVCFHAERNPSTGHPRNVLAVERGNPGFPLLQE
jgi:hypothetical protein